MGAKTSEEYHKQFLEDRNNHLIYYKYLKQQFKHIEFFNEEELQKYHKAYAILTDSQGNFSGSAFRIKIKSIMDSIKLPKEKYIEYKNYILESIEQYNKFHMCHLSKQIKI